MRLTFIAPEKLPKKTHPKPKNPTHSKMHFKSDITAILHWIDALVVDTGVPTVSQFHP